VSAREDGALEKIAMGEATGPVYRELLRRLKPIGRWKVEPKGTSLHIVRGRAFLGVHYRKNGLLLNVVLDRELPSGRARKREQISRNRYHNEILVETPAELDGELVEWIREAFELAGA